MIVTSVLGKAWILWITYQSSRQYPLIIFPLTIGSILAHLSGAAETGAPSNTAFSMIPSESFRVANSSRQKNMTLAPRLKPISETGLWPCCLDRRISARYLPTSADRLQEKKTDIVLNDRKRSRQPTVCKHPKDCQSHWKR